MVGTVYEGRAKNVVLRTSEDGARCALGLSLRYAKKRYRCLFLFKGSPMDLEMVFFSALDEIATGPFCRVVIVEAMGIVQTPQTQVTSLSTVTSTMTSLVLTSHHPSWNAISLLA